MPSPDSQAVLKALQEASDFAKEVGLKADATALAKFHKRFQNEKPTLKTLRGEVEEVRNEFAKRVRDKLLDEWRNPRPGMEAMARKSDRISVAMLNIIYPPEPKTPETNISKWKGSRYVERKSVPYEGDVKGVREIVERSIDVVRRYSKAIGKSNFEAAYELTDAGLQSWMSLKRFVSAYDRSAEEYDGPALEYHIERFNFVLADNKARTTSNTSVEGWPKGTIKANRRCTVGGFWIRDKAEQTGCGGTLWIAEESDEYRIAKFDFWVP